MIKKIEILGIRINNYTVREAMLQVEAYLNDTAMKTIEEISMDTLVAAKDDNELKDFIEGLDLAVIYDKEILKAAGADTSERVWESAERQFLPEFLKRIMRNGKSVYLFGETKQQLSVLQGFLEENYNRLNILGSFAMEDCVGDYDGAVNEINIASPDVVFSVLPTPAREYFLMENRGKINTNIWFELGSGYEKISGVSKIKKQFLHLIQKGRLHSMVSKYEQEK